MMPFSEWYFQRGPTWARSKAIVIVRYLRAMYATMRARACARTSRRPSNDSHSSHKKPTKEQKRRYIRCLYAQCTKQHHLYITAWITSGHHVPTPWVLCRRHAVVAPNIPPASSPGPLRPVSRSTITAGDGYRRYHMPYMQNIQDRQVAKRCLPR